MKNRFHEIEFFATLSAVLLGFAAQAADVAGGRGASRSTLLLNEAMASNKTVLSTPDGTAGLDWVEIFNPGDTDVSLEGWCLTDAPGGKASKRKPILGGAKIPANGYLVVFLDKEKTDWAAGVAHAAVGLSADGETIALVDPSGQVVSRLDFGPQFWDVSVGPGKGPGSVVYFRTPTPGAANGTDGRSGFSPKVMFSEPHGYKTAPFTLSMSSANPRASIYYTLDGSSPTKASAKFTAPIPVSKTTVVRARAIVEGAAFEPILEQDYSATYLFVEDIVRQGPVPPDGFLPENLANNGQQKIYYGMDTRKFLSDDGRHVTNKFVSSVNGRRINLEYDVTQRLYDGFTNDIRTVSLVIDPKALFDAETGIYNHALKQGDAWERPTMVEQIHPGDKADEFSAACGIRIRGAITRSPGYPKRSFHLVFRNHYGYGKLRHPLFGDEGAKVFERIDLRNDQTAYPGGGNKETMVHELFSRDCQRDLGTTHNRSRYLNLFINGIYWGLYMYEERANDFYAASYNGGEAKHYDIVRTYMDDATNGRTTGLVAGRDDWVKDFWLDTTLAQGYGTDHPANYNRVRGLNPDGTRNPDYPVYLNVTNLIRYVLVSHYVADTDSPCNSQAAVNNIIAFRNRVDGEGKEDGFLWVRHDAEQSLAFGMEVKWGNNTDAFSGIDTPNGARKDNSLFGVFNGSTMLGFKGDNKTVIDTDLSHFNPHMLHYRLCDNAEYRTVFADQVYRHLLREGGAMTPTNNYLRYTARMHEIRNAIAGETARWGAKSNSDYLTWIRTCAANLAFLELRTPHLIGIYRSRGWYPAVDAPSATKGGAILRDGDTLAKGDLITLTGAGGTIYYTLDGSDPRREGGAVNASARTYSAPFPIASAVATLKARVRSAEGEWSALEEVTVLSGAAAALAKPSAAVRVAEVMSSSACANQDADDYLVLTNLASSAVSLGGVKLVAWNAKKKTEEAPSLVLVFPVGTQIAGRGSLTLTADAFAGGKLTNSDVGLRLYDVSGAAPVLFQDCFVSGKWFGGACDGGGASFVATEFGASVKTENQWRASTEAALAKGSDVQSKGDVFVLTGRYDGEQKLSPTGPACRVVLNGATIPGGLLLNGTAKFTFEPAAGTTNQIGTLYGPSATVTLDGKGAVVLKGADTLATVSNLHVKAGTLVVRSTGTAQEKTPVVNILGYVKQTGGTIGIDLAKAGRQTYGLYLGSKNPKGTDTAYGEFAGGTLRATVGGAKSSAIYGNKGSVNVAFKDGATVKAHLVGVETRLLNAAGKLKLHGGDFTVTAATSAANVRVFKCDREIDIRGGVYRVNAPGPGSEIFAASKNKNGDPSAITVSGGTFELVSDDDCFNADDHIVVSGGLFHAVSLSDDVFDSNGDMTLSGGTILAFSAGPRHEAFDVEPLETTDWGVPHVLTVSGGTIIGTGGAGSFWPAKIAAAPGVSVYKATGLAAASHSGKYLSLVGTRDGKPVTTTVKLPAFPGALCSVFATCEGMAQGATPTLSATPPAKGSCDFHELYVEGDDLRK